MAYHCGLTAADVDDLTVPDFLRYTLGIDRLREEIREANRG